MTIYPTWPQVAVDAGTTDELLIAPRHPGTVELESDPVQRFCITLLGPFLIFLPALWSQQVPSRAPQPGPRGPRYIAVASNLTAWPPAEPLGAVLLFDRETVATVGRVDFSQPAQIIGASSGQESLYVYTGDPDPKIHIVDPVAVAVRSVIPLPVGGISAKLVEDASGAQHVLVGYSDNRVAVIDPATSDASWIQCSVTPRTFVHNPFDDSTYAYNSLQSDICVITPDFQLGSPISTPVVTPHSLDSLMVIDNGGAGTLLVTTYSGTQYINFAIDPRAPGVPALPVPSLDAVLPSRLSPSTHQLYGQTVSGRTSVLQRYQFTFGPDGTPTFTPQLALPAAQNAPAVADDRYLYVPIIGYCSTIEGPVICAVGFRLLDALTLEPRQINGSVILAQPVSYGLWTTRSVFVALSGTRPLALPDHPHR